MARNSRKWVRTDRCTRMQRVIDAWGGVCIVCGEPFRDLESATMEHVVPRSKGGVGLAYNLAPSHWRCNQLRGTRSIIDAAARVRKVRRRMGSGKFESWVNAKVPCRYGRTDKRGSDDVEYLCEEFLEAFEFPQEVSEDGIPFVARNRIIPQCSSCCC